MADIPLIQLNDRWSIAHDDSRQWILQRNDNRKSGRWTPLRFHTQRTWLLHSIAELVCGVTGAQLRDPAAAIRKAGCLDESTLATILDWPERYRDWRATWTLEPSA